MWRCYRNFSKLGDKYEEKRKRFFHLEKLWQAVLDLSKLTPDELEIHISHERAVNNLHFSYTDPFSKEKIFTRYYHYLSGACCGQACRHCTYNFENVPEPLLKTKIFNTSFWTDSPHYKEEEKNKIKNLIKLIRVKPKKGT